MVTAPPPPPFFFLDRTVVYAPYEEGPCREQMMIGEFSDPFLGMPLLNSDAEYSNSVGPWLFFLSTWWGFGKCIVWSRDSIFGTNFNSGLLRGAKQSWIFPVLLSFSNILSWEELRMDSEKGMDTWDGGARPLWAGGGHGHWVVRTLLQRKLPSPDLMFRDNRSPAARKWDTWEISHATYKSTEDSGLLSHWVAHFYIVASLFFVSCFIYSWGRNVSCWGFSPMNTGKLFIGLCIQAAACSEWVSCLMLGMLFLIDGPSAVIYTHLKALGCHYLKLLCSSQLQDRAGHSLPSWRWGFLCWSLSLVLLIPVLTAQGMTAPSIRLTASM